MLCNIICFNEMNNMLKKYLFYERRQTDEYQIFLKSIRIMYSFTILKMMNELSTNNVVI